MSLSTMTAETKGPKQRATLAVAGLLLSLAWPARADEAPSASSLAQVDGLAAVCSEVDAPRAEQYRAQGRALVGLRSERKLAVVRRTPEYGRVYASLMDEGSQNRSQAAAACAQWLQAAPVTADAARGDGGAEPAPQ